MPEIVKGFEPREFWGAPVKKVTLYLFLCNCGTIYHFKKIAIVEQFTISFFFNFARYHPSLYRAAVGPL